MPNGNFLALLYTGREITRDDEVQLWTGDLIVEFDRDTNDIVWSWDTFDHYSTLDIDPTVMSRPGRNGTYDWTHGNACVYNPADNSVYFSARSLSRITRIDYDTGEIVYNMGFDMPSGDTDFGHNLFSFQHAPQLLPNGNMMVYDNGNRRDGVVIPRGEEGITKSIELAFTGGAVPTDASIVWEWTHPRYSGFLGDADRLPGGNTLSTGNNGTVYEVDLDGNLIWQLELVPTIDYAIYRAERVPQLVIAPPPE